MSLQNLPCLAASYNSFSKDDFSNTYSYSVYMRSHLWSKMISPRYEEVGSKKKSAWHGRGKEYLTVSLCRR